MDSSTPATDQQPQASTASVTSAPEQQQQLAHRRTKSNSNQDHPPSSSHSHSSSQDGHDDDDDDSPRFPHFAHDLPWSQRTWAYELMPFRGIYYDIKRRLPFYPSDWTLAFTRTDNYWIQLTSVVQIYFLNLMPALAYTLDLNHRTNGAYGVNETILVSAMACIVFPIFAVQPLAIVGLTGLTSLYSFTVYDIFVHHYGFDNIKYLKIQAWAFIWGAVFHFLVAIFNICDFTRFITDMTTQTFGFYVGIVYIQKGIELLILEFKPDEQHPNLDNSTGWLSVTIAILFTVSVYLVTAIGQTRFLTLQIRHLFSAFALAAGCIFWTGFSHFPDHSLRRIPIERLPITRSWFPTMDRGWFIEFWDLELKWVFVGAPLGFCILVLFYFDHQVSSISSQARQFPVKRPAGFHWDFFLLGVTTLISGFLGLPAPNGLVPQAPVHTESLTVFKQVDVDDDDHDDDEHALAGDGREEDGSSDATRPVDDVQDPSKQRRSPPSSATQRKQQRIITDRVAEQRVSHLAIGLLTLGTMTRPLLVCLGLMPRAVFAGVFILVGWGSIESNTITVRTLALFKDRRLDAYVPLPEREVEREREGRLFDDGDDDEEEEQKSPVGPSADQGDPLLSVPKRKIALFVAVQWLFFAMTFAISQTIAAIGFPIIITPLIAVRYYLVPHWFTPLELRILDAPTADADVVLASLGHESEQVTGQGVRIARDCAGMAGTEYGRHRQPSLPSKTKENGEEEQIEMRNANALPLGEELHPRPTED